MYVHRVRHVTRDYTFFEYRIYDEEVQEMWVSNKGRDLLYSFGWNPRRNTYVSETTDRLLRHQGCLRLRGHAEPYTLDDLDELVGCGTRETDEDMCPCKMGRAGIDS